MASKIVDTISKGFAKIASKFKGKMGETPAKVDDNSVENADPSEYSRALYMDNPGHTMTKQLFGQDALNMGPCAMKSGKCLDLTYKCLPKRKPGQTFDAKAHRFTEAHGHNGGAIGCQWTWFFLLANLLCLTQIFTFTTFLEVNKTVPDVALYCDPNMISVSQFYRFAYDVITYDMEEEAFKSDDEVYPRRPPLLGAFLRFSNATLDTFAVEPCPTTILCRKGNLDWSTSKNAHTDWFHDAFFNFPEGEDGVKPCSYPPMNGYWGNDAVSVQEENACLINYLCFLAGFCCAMRWIFISSDVYTRFAYQVMSQPRPVNWSCFCCLTFDCCRPCGVFMYKRRKGFYWIFDIPELIAGLGIFYRYYFNGHLAELESANICENVIDERLERLRFQGLFLALAMESMVFLARRTTDVICMSGPRFSKDLLMADWLDGTQTVEVAVNTGIVIPEEARGEAAACMQEAVSGATCMTFCALRNMAAMSFGITCMNLDQWGSYNGTFQFGIFVILSQVVPCFCRPFGFVYQILEPCFDDKEILYSCFLQIHYIFTCGCGQSDISEREVSPGTFNPGFRKHWRGITCWDGNFPDGQRPMYLTQAEAEKAQDGDYTTYAAAASGKTSDEEISSGSSSPQID